MMTSIEGWCGSEPVLTDSSKNDARGTTDTRTGSGRPKSGRTTDNIAVVQDLICSHDAPHTHYVLCGATIVVHFNYVKLQSI